MGEIMTFEPTEAQFGVFWKYLQRPNVTDVDYNGSELWITDLKIGRYRVKEHLSDAFISTFTHNISNCVNRQFNNANKVLEADTRELRISIIHEAAAASGTSICIRKSPSMVRMNIERMLEEDAKEFAKGNPEEVRRSTSGENNLKEKKQETEKTE